MDVFYAILDFQSLNEPSNNCDTCASNFIKKETLAQVFSCEFCEISKSTFFTENLWATASGNFLQPLLYVVLTCIRVLLIIVTLTEPTAN